MNLSLQVICKTHKKPCEVINIQWYKKIRKVCCEEIINMQSRTECVIDNWIILI